MCYRYCRRCCLVVVILSLLPFDCGNDCYGVVMCVVVSLLWLSLRTMASCCFDDHVMLLLFLLMLMLMLVLWLLMSGHCYMFGAVGIVVINGVGVVYVLLY